MQTLITNSQVRELNKISCVVINDPNTGNKRPAVEIGAAVTLSSMEEYFNKLIQKVIIFFSATLFRQLSYLTYR